MFIQLQMHAFKPYLRAKIKGNTLACSFDSKLSYRKEDTEVSTHQHLESTVISVSSHFTHVLPSVLLFLLEFFSGNHKNKTAP